MKITNCGRGVHKREIVGIAKLQSLPGHWYAYTNLDLAISPGKSREIDVIMVADDRIFLIDLKDWGGKIESKDGRWLHNGRDNGASPVNKIHENSRDIAILLSSHLRKHGKIKGLIAPRIQGFVVITANADLRGIAATEINSVIHVDDFIKKVVTPGFRVKAFGAVNRSFVDKPLTSQDWKHQLTRFFNVQSGIFKPGRRNYGGFIATSDTAVFEHHAKIYAEYEVEDEKAVQTHGTLRIWDFTKADTRFQNEDGREEIVGRERDVVAYLQDRSEDCELAILQPKAEDPERGVHYWEVYDRRRRLKRLMDFAATEAADLGRDDKVELARQILSKVNALHLVGAAHLDLGGHSIWLQQPSTVRLSHLMAASYPQIQSLGETRYQFLSSATVPEDVLGGGMDAKRKDVFLLGVAIHHLFFGRDPCSENDQMPPEWSSTVDEIGEYGDLHAWFEVALAMDPSDRFSDAGAALDTFNEAISVKPSEKEIIEGLEQFTSSIKSQMQLFGILKPIKIIRDGTTTAIWQSEVDGALVFVKMWKRASWGDQVREGARILDFLSRARDLQRSPLPSCPRIMDVMWLGDAIVIVQDWIDSPNLADLIQAESDAWSHKLIVLDFLKVLTERVTTLHDLAVAHGDLKPQNILIIKEDRNIPVFVDFIDFTSTDDGEIVSSAYAPSQGGRYERDRYAVTKIAEDLLNLCGLDAADSADLHKSISECRTNTPPNGTLLPLMEALDRVLSPSAVEHRPLIQLSFYQAETGPVLSDEGLFYLRRAPDRECLFIRGACEEIEIGFNGKGEAFRGKRRAVDQKSISITSKYDFMSIAVDIVIMESGINDFSGLEVILEDQSFVEAWSRAAPAVAEDEGDDEKLINGDGFGDGAEDALMERISEEPTATVYPNVPNLWKVLIDAERELTTEGIAISESSYNRELNRHVVPFELESGKFDYNRDDRVLVERLDRKGHWQRIGNLDSILSRHNFVVIDVTRFMPPNSTRVVDEDQRLRFTSHFEETSLQRRDNAISRILSKQSRIPDIIDVFDPRSGKMPFSDRVNVDPGLLEATYGLNKIQAHSLSALLDIRPVGLLQGPPGTGKTLFIAALVHYALTHDLARNVLLASQSHEAVNNAADFVLKLFAKNKDKPSILRVGPEGMVSDRLLPFHTDRVEQLYKDRFRASMKERLCIAGRSLGIDDVLTNDVIFIEMAICPIVGNIIELEDAAEPDTQKIASLRATIADQLKAIKLANVDLENVVATDIVDAIISNLTKRFGINARISPDKIHRLRELAKLARDFVGSVSTSQRSFETFLAGTRQIVAGTCVGLGRASLGLTTTLFDLVIVDEAARCTASELSVPIQAGRWVVLVGDHAQLEPSHKPEIIAQVATEVGITQREVIRSDFERTFIAPYGLAAGRSLTKQYRMLPPIGRLVSSSFYEKPLEHGRVKPEIDPAVLPEDLDKALLWIETDSFGEQGFQRSERDETSLTNPIEVDLILNLLTNWDECSAFIAWLEMQSKHAHPIGIICTYGAQRDLLRKKLQITNLSAKLKSSIEIDTVDSYQGKENPIVILSLVRNNADGRQEHGVATIKDGFMSRPNRINVAVSRAMDRLVIVGSKGRWRSQSPMHNIVCAFGREIGSDNARIIEGISFISMCLESKKLESKQVPSTPIEEA